MSDEGRTRAAQGIVVKVLVPALIVLAIIGLWFLKNPRPRSEALTDGNPDFALNADENTDVEKLKSYGLPIIIDFGADWCAPCRQIAPILEELNGELRGKAIIKFVDVDRNRGFAADYPVSVIPTQVFIDSAGKPFAPENPDAIDMTTYVDRETGEHVLTMHEGFMTKDQLLSVLKEMGMQ